MPIFPATAPTSGGGQVALYQIEQAVAPRIGPYALRAQSSATAAVPLATYFDELKSSVAPGGVDGYLLRRGYKSDGTTVTVSASDRQRMIDSVNPLTGGVIPDRAWTTPPVALEYLEFHHLDPALELRPAVLAGLRRCFFEDRATVTLSSAATERDLTTLVSWITDPSQIRRYQFTTTGATLLPSDVPWAMPFEQGGHVWLAAWPDQYPNTLLITAQRPHFTWVNGADSATGPTADADLLSVDLNYAAAAAHIEAWRLFPSKLKQAADGGYQTTQQQAAAEFTRVATTINRRRRNSWGLTGPFSIDRLSLGAR